MSEIIRFSSEIGGDLLLLGDEVSQLHCWGNLRTGATLILPHQIRDGPIGSSLPDFSLPSGCVCVWAFWRVAICSRSWSL